MVTHEAGHVFLPVSLVFADESCCLLALSVPLERWVFLGLNQTLDLERKVQQTNSSTALLRSVFPADRSAQGSR
ncbi:MAG: hypothetical protein DWH78_03075 [Planctomycetota bacterium]|nr:MAG: hypothetical protein DWH78_03075 [Planctomycetota bacterium]